MLWMLPLLPVVAGLAMAGVRRGRAVATVGHAALVSVLGLAVWAASASPVATWRWGAGLELSLAASGFGRVMTVLVPLVALPVLGYAAATETYGRTRLLALLVGFVGAMQVLVLAGDLLTLLIGWELVGATSWALVGHVWRDADNGRSAARAFVTTRFGDLGLYLAAGITFAATGSLDITAIEAVDEGQLQVIAGGVLVAAAAKSAQLPFSPWLFSAMAGPTPASALLHSATMVSAGAYVLVRLAPSFEAVTWFAPTVAGVGLATALAGGLVAVSQRHIKRVLAGSTSAQYGLMFLAIGAGSTAAAGAQLVAHALFKSLLFLAAGVAIHAAGDTDLTRMSLGRWLPRTAGMAAVGALALAAVPPLGGAWTKEQIVATAFERSFWLGVATLVAALLTAAYATRLWLLAFGRGARHRVAPVTSHRPDAPELAALATLAGASVVLGMLWLPASARLVETATGGTLVHGGLPGLLAAWVAVVVAVAGMVVLHRRSRLASIGFPEEVRRFVAGWFGLPAAARGVVVTPVLWLSRRLAAGDDRVIDAGVRASVALAATLSRTLARVGELSFTAAAHAFAGGALHASHWLRRRVERGVDAVVAGIAAATDLLASASRRLDEGGVDAVVEALARGTGSVGQRTRGTQTGLSHQYYLYATVGAAVSVLTLVVFR